MMEWLNDAHNWVALSFLIFCVLAWVLGRKPVTQKLDGRIAQIRQEIQTAESLRNEAQALLAQYKKQQQEAAAEAKRIVDHARHHAEDLRRAAEQGLEEAAQRRERQLEERLKRMEEAAMNEIRAYAAELAVKATAEIIAAHMDEQTNARLIDDSIRELADRAA